MLVWAAGNGTRPIVSKLIARAAGGTADDATKRRGKLVVDGWMRVKGLKNVLALGDCTLMEEYPLPSTAQVAGQQGAFVGRMVSKVRAIDTRGAPMLRDSRDKELHPFRFLSLGIMAYIGNGKALVQVDTSEDSTVAGTSRTGRTHVPAAPLLPGPFLTLVLPGVTIASNRQSAAASVRMGGPRPLRPQPRRKRDADVVVVAVCLPPSPTTKYSGECARSGRRPVAAWPCETSAVLTFDLGLCRRGETVRALEVGVCSEAGRRTESRPRPHRLSQDAHLGARHLSVLGGVGVARLGPAGPCGLEV
jgi:hypothetical protein